MTRRARPRRAPAVFGFGALLALSACSVTGLQERDSPIAENRCDSSSDCRSSGRCLDGMCVARSGTLSTLLFEITPGGNAGDVSGEQFLVLASGLASGETPIHFALDHVALRGRVQAAVRAGCDPVFVGNSSEGAASPQLVRRAADRSIPVQVTFIPSAARLDLPVVTRTARVETGMDEVPDSYSFDVRLPAGTYDVYVVPFEPRPPLTSAAGTCALAPQLIRGQTVLSDGAQTTSFELALPLPRQLDLDVRWPEALGDLRDWTLDVVEDEGGRVISSRERLVAPANEDGTLVYSARLAYLPVVNQESFGSVASPRRELVRLSPPEGVAAATVLFDRAALELFSPGHGVIDGLPAFDDAVSVEGVVTEAVTGLGRPAQLGFDSVELAGAAEGVLTSFSRTVEARENGSFKVELLPGTYRVRALPDIVSDGGRPLAATEALWTIAATPEVQAGRALELLDAAEIGGRAVVDFGGDGARGAVVAAAASPWTLTSTALERGIRGEPLAPRATSATVIESSGEFTLYSDPGVFDFYVRTPEGSNLAWLVRPGFEVPFAGANVMLDVELPLPVRVPASVRLLKDPSAAPRLAGSLVRVYALIDAAGNPTGDIEEAESVIPIAESRLGDGAFTTLLVPAALDGAGIAP